MRHGSLFSGIGGFDLAASWMGWENVFQCERDPFCRKVLGHYWPKAVCYEDVRMFDATEYWGRIDVLTGGFPCQPFSMAGKRKGTEDDRYLWPEMCRIIGEVRPRWVVGENVLGLLNWSRGLVFEQVFADLEAAGYEAWAYVLPAAGVGAPHYRDRIWFVAYAGGLRCAAGGSELRVRGDRADGEEGVAADANGDECSSDGQEHDERRKTVAADGGEADVSDPHGGKRREGRLYTFGPEAARGDFGGCDTWDERDAWENFPSESPLCAGNDGLSAGLDGITFPKWRFQSVKAAGNAIVPQVVWRIFRTIAWMESLG
jgi:DNA (cytosine-5)-methyltransferase 1